MSELINNREHRQQVLKELITELHQGQSVEAVKARFKKLIEGVSATEISEMEQALIQGGMPLEEIQKLCDVHAAIFKGSIAEIHSPQNEEDSPGHPVHSFKLENRELEKLIKIKILPALESLVVAQGSETVQKLQADFASLWEIDKHYSRKENLLFPIMEKHGITAPPKVMWGVDDEIRDAIKEMRRLLNDAAASPTKIKEMGKIAVERVLEMIFKEEKILFPMVIEKFSEREWISVAESSAEIGYCLTQPQRTWKTEQKGKAALSSAANGSFEGYVELDAGLLLPVEINAILNTLPLDITFVGKDGTVKYFTQGKERIFARTKTILGRKVENCHPPTSVHIVEQIVADLSSGKKDHEDFWIRMGETFAYIRYFTVRNAEGEYLGIMEVTQNIKPIQEITGEKRLLSE